MYFKALPEKVKDGIIFLNQDAIFRQRFREDAVLDELDEEELDLDLCNAHLRQVFRGEYEVEGVKVKPMTLAVWSWLWTISSPFIRQSAAAVKVEDIDRFFYYLDKGVRSDGDSRGYCLKKGLTPASVMKAVSSIIKDAFSPMNLLPRHRQGGSGEERDSL